MERKAKIEKDLEPELEQEEKRYEEMTSEELHKAMKKKRQQQMNKQLTIRKYQFVGFTAIGIFYMMIYRQFLHPKTVYGNTMYSDAVRYIQANKIVAKQLGPNLQIMNCEGKTYPLLKNCKFSLIAFGNQNKGKFQVEAQMSPTDKKKWDIQSI